MQQIQRHRVLTHCGPFLGGNRNLLIIQAQAGQGKSTVARQILEHLPKPHVVVYCDNADTNLVNLADKVLGALASLQPGMDPAKWLTPLYACKTEADIFQALPRIFDGIAAELSPGQGYILLEDAHLLTDSEASLRLVRLLFEHLSTHLPLLITTRTQLSDGARPLFRITEMLLINNETLAFDKSEIFELYRRVYGITLDGAKADELLTKTEGWPTGLSLLRGRLDDLAGHDHLAPGPELDQYFISQCLSILSPKQAEELLLLAQLEDIPKAMLADVGMTEAWQALEILQVKGLFVAVVERAGQQICRIHHLLQDCLRGFVAQSVGRHAAGEFCVRAGQWHLERGHVGEGLALLGRSGDWQALKAALMEPAPGLMMTNKLYLVAQALADCPSEVINQEPWFGALLGHHLLPTKPEDALVLLEKAWQVSKEFGDEMAQLLAGMGAISILLVFPSDLRKLGRYVNGTVKVFEKLQSSGKVPTELDGLCSYLISVGTSFSSADYEQANRYAKRADDVFRLAFGQETPLEMSMAQVHAEGNRGHLTEAQSLLQKHFFQLYSPNVSESSKYLAYSPYFNYSQMRGDFTDYRTMCKDAQQLIPMLAKSGGISGFFHIWEMDILLSEGKRDQVLKRAKIALALPVIASSNHIASQCYQYIAMVKASQGKRQDALSAIRTAMKMRAAVGGEIFVLLNRVVAGGVYALLGESQIAERILLGALKRQARIEEFYQRPQSYAYLAYTYKQQGRNAQALECLENMLSILAAEGNYHFFYWEAGMVRGLLEFYFQHTPEPIPFAFKLYQRRYNLDWRPDGDPVPRLYLSLAEGRIYKSEDPGNYLDLAGVPGKETLLLECLMRSPDRPVRRETIVDRIWPESSKAENPSNNLHQTVHKLRAKLAAISSSKLAKEYLQTSSAGIALCHVDVDLSLLLDQARKGLADLREDRFWMADLHFKEMRRLADPFPADFQWLPEEVNLLTSACEAWTDLCKRANNPKTALIAVELGRKIDPLHERLYELHYDLLLELDQLPKAAKVRNEYEAMLEELEG